MKLKDFTLIRSDRRTLAVQVGSGGVVVRAPRRTPQREIERFVASRLGWINEKLAQVSAAKDLAEPFSRAELAALKSSALVWFEDAVRRLSPLVGVEAKRVSVRPMLSRWGSCSPDGALCFNTLLMLAPENVRESVVLHELCHRVYMDHSPRFHALLQKVCPDYPERRRWLVANGLVFTARLRRTKSAGS